MFLCKLVVFLAYFTTHLIPCRIFQGVEVKCDILLGWIHRHRLLVSGLYKDGIVVILIREDVHLLYISLVGHQSCYIEACHWNQ